MTRGVILPVTGIGLVLILGWCGWRLGHSDTQADSLARSFRVQGSSMVPTLVGSFATAPCTTCRLVWLIDSGGMTASDEALTCAHCGQPMKVQIGPAESGTDEVRSDDADGFDTVTIETIPEMNDSGRELSRGDLVAVQVEGQLHVKRVAAMPGDRVSLQASKLLVNGVRIEDELSQHACLFPLPWMLVDDDSRRAESRWASQGQSKIESQPWTRYRPGHWSVTGNAEGPWLLYGHRSTRRGNLPAPVWDDYPFNVSLARKLFEVDRLRLRGRSSTDFHGEVAFWSGNGTVMAKCVVAADQDFSISYFDGVASAGLPVVSAQPVAIRVTRGTAALTELVVERLVEYRLRPHDDRGNYPLELGPDQWFVVGDNVPVSVDSRQWGPLSVSQLIGRVESRNPPVRHFVTPIP